MDGEGERRAIFRGPRLIEELESVSMTEGIEGKVVVITGAFAMCQPEDVDINEILFRRTRQEL